MLEITPLQKNDLSASAALFARHFKQQRRSVPALPGALEAPDQVGPLLEKLLARSAGLAAWDHGQMAGFLAWFLIADLRDTGCKAAYVPEWGHAARAGDGPAIYRALYRAAGKQWAEAGCRMHAITLLAQDRTARETWFWNGFGMAVVDAICPAAPLQPTPQTSLQVRPARLDDAEALYALDIEHCRHYSQAPVFMTPRTPASASEWREFLSQEHHSAWLAVDGSQAAGFIRFEPDSEGACAIVASQGTIAITGAYVHPLVRGRQAAPAILDAALHHYAAQGFTRCAVDFESFNPEAATFWLKYFKPVCYSLTRVPEDALG